MSGISYSVMSVICIAYLFQNIMHIPVRVTEDFERGLGERWMVERPTRQGLRLASDPLDENNNVAKFVLSDSDRMVSNGLRSEITYNHHLEKDGSEGWYKWRFMVDERHSNNSDWEILGQWHARPDPKMGQDWDNWDYRGSRPVIGVVYHRGEIFIFASNEKEGITEVQTQKIPVESGKWIDVALHVKWSRDWDGYLESWVDGEPLMFSHESIEGEMVSMNPVKRLNYPTLMNGAGNFLKLGTYRNRAEPEGLSIVYYDDVEMKVIK